MVWFGLVVDGWLNGRWLVRAYIYEEEGIQSTVVTPFSKLLTLSLYSSVFFVFCGVHETRGNKKNIRFLTNSYTS